MSDVDKYKEAERRWASGDVEGGLNTLLHVCANGGDDRIRLEAALLIVDRLKPTKYPNQILQACDIGIACAGRLRDPLPAAYLMGKKAETLEFLKGVSLVPERHALRMAPGWFGFSLERDESRFKELTRKIEEMNAEVDDLLSKALAISEAAGSHSTKAHILSSTGQVHANIGMNLHTEYLRAPIRLPSVLLRLLRPYRLDQYFLFTKKERAKMDECLKKCENSYLMAVEESRKAGDEPGIAYAYFNLANHLRSAFRFHKAKKYLRLAKQIAERHNEKRLLPGIKVLEDRIRRRNRNTPNYLAGERSEIPE